MLARELCNISCSYKCCEWLLRYFSRACSDGHGYGIPWWVTGTGCYGTGTGAKISPCDVPIPVLAGDGFVTCVMFQHSHHLTAQWQQAPTTDMTTVKPRRPPHASTTTISSVNNDHLTRQRQPHHALTTTVDHIMHTDDDHDGCRDSGWWWGQGLGRHAQPHKGMYCFITFYVHFIILLQLTWWGGNSPCQPHLLEGLLHTPYHMPRTEPHPGVISYSVCFLRPTTHAKHRNSPRWCDFVFGVFSSPFYTRRTWNDTLVGVFSWLACFLRPIHAY